MRMLSLFSGVGGWALGFRAAGHECVGMLEPDPFAQKGARAVLPDVPLFTDEYAHHNSLPFCDAVSVSHPLSVNPSLAHDHARRLCKALSPRVIVAELFPSGFAAGTMAWLAELGYKTYVETLNAMDFGLPQDRHRKYAVSFCPGYKPPFLSFPFPEAVGPPPPLSALLDEEPTLATPGLLERIAKEEEACRKAGRRFKCRRAAPGGACPPIPPRYYKDRSDLLVDDPRGPRTLSVAECARLMGFKHDFNDVVSPSQAYRLLAASTCPPVAAAVAAELAVWLES